MMNKKIKLADIIFFKLTPKKNISKSPSKYSGTGILLPESNIAQPKIDIVTVVKINFAKYLFFNLSAMNNIEKNENLSI